MAKTHILIVDDEPVVRALLVELLRGEDSSVAEASTAAEAQKLAGAKGFDIILVDTDLRDKGHLDLIRDFKQRDPSCEVLVMSTSPSIHSAMDAAKAGASDYLVKPFDDIRQVAMRVERAIKQVGLKRERKRLHQALQESEERYRMLFEASPDAVIVYDAETRAIKEANSAALTLYERDEAELLGQSIDAIRRQDDAHDLEKTSPGIRLRRDVSASGSVVDVEVSAGYFRVDGRRMIIEVARDIRARLSAERAREELQEQLRQAQKMEALGKLAGGIAHDFNNLLAVILNYAGFVADAVQKDAPSDLEQTREDIELVLQAAASATSVTRQLLAFSRREVLSPEVLNVNDVVVAIENLLRRTLNEHIKFETHLDETLGLVEIDRAQLEQVLVNLVVNAQDAMPQGGLLRVETRQVDTVPNEPRARAFAAHWVVLQIEDTGTGIKADLHQSIFEPFFTTKDREKGTGLGLATFKAIIERARGRIQVESRPGEGTRFLVYLPVSNKKVARGPSVRPSASPSQGHGERILVVDDDDALRRAACRMLVKAGFEPVEARSGQEAIDLAKQHGDVVLLLTDMVMPNMTGFELATQLQMDRPDLPVVYMTGYAVPDSMGASRGAGQRIVPKPFREQRLIKVVRDALNDDVIVGSDVKAKLA